MKTFLMDAGAKALVVSKMLGPVRADNGTEVEADFSHATTASVVFDAVYVPGGDHVQALSAQGEAVHFVQECFKHHKTIGAGGDGVGLLAGANLGDVALARADDTGVTQTHGVVTAAGAANAALPGAFIEALKQHRHWQRAKEQVPA